ncbi:amidase [Rhodosalinus sp.]|uniref:amidase n=1 Tax=Rhodosalinus sp. TaxID=2047741 RepID=UPI00397AAC70
MQDWLRMGAAALGRGIGEGRIDPVALTEAFLDAAQAHPLRDRIYARLTPERARAEATAAAERARLGLRRSPLDGVPVSWKDLFDTAGTATEAGSALLRGRVPARDAEVLRNATLAGLVCLGKTHLSELAFSGLGYNPITATPPSVNDAGAVSGGSSSGAAASVAFGLAAAAVGSDTGGSVRVPAAWNDLVGLKTTAGRVPLAGVVPLAARFDTVGPLARTVEDAALMLAVLEGRPAPDLRGARLAGAQLAEIRTIAFDDLRDGPREGYEHAVARLTAAGAEVVPIEVPELAGPMGDSALLYTSEAYAAWREVIEATPDAMFPEILERFRGGARTLAADYLAAWERMMAARRTWAAATAGFDAVICPTVANLPPRLDRLRTEGDYYKTENLLTLRNTRIGNLMGLPALTLPTGVPSTGLQMLGRPMGEAALLRLGAATEAALD